MKATRMPSGRESTITRDERTWRRNAAHTSTTKMNSWVSFVFRFSIALSMTPARLYVVTSSTPSGRLGFSVSIFCSTALIVVSALPPQRIITTPPTASPSPLKSPTPRRISGPRRMSAMSPRVMAAPRSLTISGALAISDISST